MFIRRLIRKLRL